MNNLKEEIYLTKGKRSQVFLSKIKNKKIIIKRSLANTQTRIKHESEILKLLNKYKIGPKLIEIKNEEEHSELIEEYIEGMTIEKFLNETKNRSTKLKIIKKILEQCRTLDKLKINKEEMSNPYKHIIVTKKNKVVMIDFERARYTEHPSNVTQFFQYIFRHKIINLDDKTKGLLIEYKTNQSDSNYKELIKLVK